MLIIKIICVFTIWTIIGSVVLGFLNAMQKYFDVTVIGSIKSNYRDKLGRYDNEDRNMGIVLWSIFWPFAIIAVVPRCIIEIINFWME